MKRLSKFAALTTLLAVPLSVLASPPGRGGHRGPPPEAIEACAELAEQDTCTFTHRDQTLTGVCMPGPREDLPLACRPDDASREARKPRRGPPQEAIEACASLEADAACSFVHRDRELTGTCVLGKEDDEPLVCRPDDAPGR